MTVYTKPLPEPEETEVPYWEAVKRNELRAQKCLDCGEIWFPPNAACPECLSGNYEWTRLSGRGKVWSWVVFHQLYFSSFADDIPYNVIVVKLDEGPLMTSNMVECENEDIHCDLPVEVVFDDVTEEVTLPKFRPAIRIEPSKG